MLNVPLNSMSDITKGLQLKIRCCWSVQCVVNMYLIPKLPMLTFKQRLALKCEHIAEFLLFYKRLDCAFRDTW